MFISLPLHRLILSISTDDGSIIAGLQALDAWHEDLNFPTATQIGLLNACGSFSGIVAGPLIAFIDERFGRRWGIRCECL